MGEGEMSEETVSREEKKRGEEEDVKLWFCPNMFR